MNKAEIDLLFKKYLSDQCTESEINLLLKYFEQTDNIGLQKLIEKELINNTKTEFIFPNDEENKRLARISNDIKSIISKRKIFRNLYIYATAAMLALIIGGGILWKFHNAKQADEKSGTIATTHINEIPPGHNGAVLHLSNGSTIVLDSVQNGTITTQDNTQLIKKNGQIEYGATSKVVYNTITTDRGREWKIVLPDGTKAWMNAESSITYPTAFTGANRTVEISGEVYFEVMHNAAKPFRVKTGSQLIEDVGTAFDVRAYGDEHVIKTTLVQGSVRVSKDNQSLMLKPNQQAVTTERIELKNNVDVDEEIAWKNGYFSFQNTDLKEIMQQMSRWYNVSVEYKGNIKPDLFTGRIPRAMPGSKMLNILQEAGVHFDIEAVPENGKEGKIIVTP
ncbi:MAG: FecR domain-containing protein [Arachidicoccus sp.]|nr:FecR domain-containing protein [Arachidicoccus sp.]